MATAEIEIYHPDAVDIDASKLTPYYRMVKRVREAGMGVVGGGDRSTTLYLYPSGMGPRLDFSDIGRSRVQQEIYERVYRKVPMAGASVDIIADYVMQAGFRITGANQSLVDRIKDWIRYMDVVLPDGFYGFLSNVVRSTLAFGDAFVEIVSSETRSQPPLVADRSRLPFKITELKILHPKTMEVVRSSTGNVTGYIQKPGVATTQGSLEIPFKPDQIWHLRFNPVADSGYGTSKFERCKAMLERKLGYEDDAALIVRRYASPIIWYALGLPNIPATQAQMDAFKGTLTEMRPGEDLITSTAVAVSVIGVQQKALDMKPYLEHTDRNMMIGLTTPEVLMGQGQDRTQATAEIEMQSFVYTVKAIQRMLKAKIEGELFTRILGRSKEAMDREAVHDLPEMEWNIVESERDRFQRISVMFKNDIVNLNEARRMSDLPEVPDGDRFLSEILHAQNMELEKMRAKAQMARTQQPAKTPPSGDKPPTDRGTPAFVQSAVAPAE